MTNKNCSKNACIHCSVTTCRHYNSSGYCTLDSISVGSHEVNPTKKECTDCNSFSMK